MKRAHAQSIDSSILEKLKPMELPPLPDNPLVSVLIANYNYGQYIGEAIESVLNQTYQNFEIIICDDGSTDNSLEVIRSYAKKDSRIKYIAKENGGVASALNECYRESAGSIICFLDSDDIFETNKLDIVVASLKEHHQTGFIVHPVLHIDSSGNPLGVYPLSGKLPSGWIANEMLEGTTAVEFPPVSGLCLRREVAEILFPLNTEFRTNADGIIQKQAPFVTSILALYQVLARRRIHRRNITYTGKITYEYVHKQIEISRKLFEEQQRFLKNWIPSLTANFANFEDTFQYRLLRYVADRLQNRDVKTNAWKHFEAHPAFKNLPFMKRFFWHVLNTVPTEIFERFINWWWTAGKFKQTVSALLWRKR